MDAASSQAVAEAMREAFEDMFMTFGVDMTWQGHNHAYQRTCPVYNNTCLGYDEQTGVARGPIHVTMGHAGFMMSPHYQPVPAAAFEGTPEYTFFGYCRVEANRTQFTMEMVDASNGTVRDEVILTKPADWEFDPSVPLEIIQNTVPTPFTENPSSAGFTFVMTTLFPKLIYSNLVGALSFLAPGTWFAERVNAFPGLPYDSEFLVQTANLVIDFVTPLFNISSLQVCVLE